MRFESTQDFEAVQAPGVRYRIRRISYGQRLELARRLHELVQRREFHRASEDATEQVADAWLGLEMDKLYLEWGLDSVEGLEIDGMAAGVGELFQRGPDTLTREIIDRIRVEAGLSEDERKN
jgi:hypothetical protein